MRAVVFQHEETEGLGLFEPALRAAGFTTLRRFREPRYEDVEAELLVVLGGNMGVHDAGLHPFLREEVAIISDRLARDLPCLGICLGAQLMAYAAGAEVLTGQNGPEIGAGKIRWTESALVDPVLAGIKRELVGAHWHGDTYQPVPGATLLASTDRYVQQAFRLGRSFGFQFHPELTHLELTGWLTREGKDLTTMKAALGKLKAVEPEWRSLAQRLADHFATAARTPALR